LRHGSKNSVQEKDVVLLQNPQDSSTAKVEEPDGSPPDSSQKRSDKREFFKTPCASSMQDEAPPKRVRIN